MMRQDLYHQINSLQHTAEIIEKALLLLKRQTNALFPPDLTDQAVDHNLSYSPHSHSSPFATQIFSPYFHNPYTLQKDVLLKALVGIERLSYLMKLKQIPLLPGEEQDIAQITYNATKAIEYLETLD